MSYHEAVTGAVPGIPAAAPISGPGCGHAGHDRARPLRPASSRGVAAAAQHRATPPRPHPVRLHPGHDQQHRLVSYPLPVNGDHPHIRAALRMLSDPFRGGRP